MRPLQKWRRHMVQGAIHLAIACLGAVIAISLLGSVKQRVGPYDAELRLTFNSLTRVEVPPLGNVEFNSHEGPLGVSINLSQLRPAATSFITNNPETVNNLGSRLLDDIRAAVRHLLVRSLIVALFGGVILTLLTQGWGLAWRSGTAATGLLLAFALVGWFSFSPESINQPRYHGLMSYAPAFVGNAQLTAGRVEAYEEELAKLVSNTVSLHQATSDLPSLGNGDVTQVLLVSDIHSWPGTFGTIQSLADGYQVDLVIDAGDLTERGLALESRFFTGIGELGVPYAYVKGNHDTSITVSQVGGFPNAVVLNGQPVEIAGLRILGGPDPINPGTPVDLRDELLVEQGQQLAQTAITDGAIDLMIVHNPLAAEQLVGTVPLVLAGHLHSRSQELVDGTLIYIEGSTGGASLRTLQTGEAVPKSASLLYFDSLTDRLVAYDQITLGGLGETEVTIERTVLEGT